MTIKQFVEEMTDQRIHKSPENWKILQHSLYVKILKKASIIITNTPY